MFITISSIPDITDHCAFEAKPRGLLFSFFVGVPCLFWEIIVVMVIFWYVGVETTPYFFFFASDTDYIACSVLFFITVIQIILLAFSIFFFPVHLRCSLDRLLHR